MTVSAPPVENVTSGRATLGVGHPDDGEPVHRPNASMMSAAVSEPLKFADR